MKLAANQNIMQNIITLIIIAVCASPIWAGEYNINGDLNVSGDAAIATNITAESVTAYGYYNPTNAASGYASFALGGIMNNAAGPYSSIGGGQNNSVAGWNSTIGGGAYNYINGQYASVIAGGQYNGVYAYCSAVGGGMQNYVYGKYAIIPGGYMNYAYSNFTFAAGYRARAKHYSSFVWGCEDYPNYFDTVADNEFAVKALGGVRFVTDTNGNTVTIQNGEITATAFIGDGSGLTNIPESASDAFVKKSGDTMSGQLTITNGYGVQVYHPGGTRYAFLRAGGPTGGRLELGSTNGYARVNYNEAADAFWFGDAIDMAGNMITNALFCGDGSGLTSINISAISGLGSMATNDETAFAPVDLSSYAGSNLTYSGNQLHAQAGYSDVDVSNAVVAAWPNLDADSTDDFSGSFSDLSNIPTGLSDGDDDSAWDGGSTGLDAATGRASLGLGSAATSDTTAFAPADLTAYAGDNLAYSAGQLHAQPGYDDADATNAVVAAWPDMDTDATDDLTLAGGTMSGEINMASNRITNVAAPVGNGDVVTKEFLRTVLSALPPQGDLSMGDFTTGEPAEFPLEF